MLHTAKALFTKANRAFLTTAKDILIIAKQLLFLIEENALLGDSSIKNFPRDHVPGSPLEVSASLALNFTGYLPTHLAVPFYFKS